MWQRFSESARRVIFYAQEEAQRLGHAEVSTEHLLLGLYRNHPGIAFKILERLGVTVEQIRTEIDRVVPTEERRPSQDMKLNSAAKRVIDLAFDSSQRCSDSHIGPEHLFLGLVRQEHGVAARILTKLGVSYEAACEAVESLHDEALKEAGASPASATELPPPPTSDPWAHYTESAKVAILASFQEKKRLGDGRVSAEHLLLAIASDHNSLAAQLLERLGASADQIRREIALGA